MRRRKLIPVLLLCVLFVIVGYLFLKLHNGVKINCVSEYRVNDNIVFYRQDNSEWMNDTLGNSSYTMKTSGCLVTCIASAISADVYSMTPGMLNLLFTEHDIYDGEGNIQWDKLQKIDGFQVELYDDVDNDYIAQCLKKGRYPIVRVRRHVLGSYHYILVVGTEDGEYICMDPLEDKKMKLSDYGKYVYAVRCVWYQ